MSADGDSPGETNCCPDCRSSMVILQRSAKAAAPGDDRGRWRCRECGHEFEEPARRPREPNGGVRGPAAVLDKMDPEDWP